MPQPEVLVYRVNLDDPDWRDVLPASLLRYTVCSAPTAAVARAAARYAYAPHDVHFADEEAVAALAAYDAVVARIEESWKEYEDATL